MEEVDKFLVDFSFNPIWTGAGVQNGPLRVFAKWFNQSSRNFGSFKTNI